MLPAFSFEGRLAGFDSQLVSPLRFADLYDPDGKKPFRLLYVSVSALWCTACKAEAVEFPALHDSYAPRGVYVLTDIAENASHAPASLDDVNLWIRAYQIPSAVIADPEFVFQAYFDKNTMPLNLIVDLHTMRVMARFVGSDLPRVRSTLEKLLANLP